MTARTKWSIARFLLTAVTLMGGWLLFTWSLTPLMLIIGTAASLLVSAFTFRFFISENEAGRRSHLPRIDYLVVYFVVLVFNMYVASFRVLWSILRGRINPRIVHFRTRLRSDMGRVALSSSITLTPGTVTVALDEDHLIVHWLNARTTHSRYSGKLIKGTFENLLRRVWR